MMLHQVTSTRLLFTIFPLTLSPTRAQVITTISPTTNWGTWEGWGVSLAWWAAKFVQEDTLADIFFPTDWTVFNSVSILGLGLNIVRYNAGASSWNTYDGSSMVVSPDILASRQVDGYWLNWASTDPTSSSWNWTVDANQRAMLTKAQSRGVNHAELFSNLSMWWMCINHNPSGNNDGADNNLQSWNYNSHAIYLAAIALEAKNSWSVTFTSVEAFNEPVSDSWVSTTGDQEGCHFDEATQATVVIYLREELTSRGLTGIIVSASDENTYDLALSAWTSFNSTAKASVGRVNTHGYEYGSGNRAGLYTLVSESGISIWNSEYGEDDATGSELVNNLMLDLNNLYPTASVYWQALDQDGWGLIDADIQAGTIGNISQKYFVLAQFTRHIREGMEILDAGSDYAVAAYDASTETLVIVAVNWSVAQYITFDLSEFSQAGVAGALVPRFGTEIGSGLQYANYSDTYISGTEFWSYFAENEVMTFEVSNVVL